MVALACLLFILGLFVGSFLLVLVDRLPKEESVIRGRSHCEHCRHTLGPLDLIPLFSYLLLGGKCRYCKKKLSRYYPFVEFVTAVAFASVVFFPTLFTFYALSFTLTLIYFLFVVSSFIVIVFTDLKYGVILDKITFFAVIVTLCYLLFFSPGVLLNHIVAGVCAFLFFYLLNITTQGRGMGFGDVKLVLWLGLLLGVWGIALCLYISFILGAAIALLLILSKKKRFKGSTIPFGPFLVISAYIVLLYGDQLISFMKTYLGI